MISSWTILWLSWSKSESASLTFCFQLVWGLSACRELTINFSHLVRVWYLQNSSKILFYTSLDGEPGPWSKAVLLPLNCFSLVSASPPFPNRQLLELRKGGWMKPKWGTQKGFCAQQPHKILLSITLSPPFPWDSILGGRWGGEGIFSPINGAVIIRQNLTPCWICFFYFDLCFSLLLFCL